MSINLYLPITCNGQPVKVLTGWVTTESGASFCLANVHGSTHAMREDGAMFHMVYQPRAIATNTPPEPNLVGVGDVVANKSGGRLFVIGVDGESLWLRPVGDGFRYSDHFSHYFTLNARPIDGVKP